MSQSWPSSTSVSAHVEHPDDLNNMVLIHQLDSPYFEFWSWPPRSGWQNFTQRAPRETQNWTHLYHLLALLLPKKDIRKHVNHSVDKTDDMTDGVTLVIHSPVPGQRPERSIWVSWLRQTHTHCGASGDLSPARCCHFVFVQSVHAAFAWSHHFYDWGWRSSCNRQINYLCNIHD